MGRSMGFPVDSPILL